MRWWDRYLFGPVAPVRPFLFARVFLLLLAADIWLGFLAASADYGAGGFDIAHFAWLDAIQPLPTPRLYIAVMVLASFTLFICGLAGLNRPLLLAGCALYTWGWMMSRHDSFQHHYMLSLVLLCVAFFPKLTARELSQPGFRAPVSAWAFITLGVQVAIVYFWTAVAKMDRTWVEGHVVRKLLLIYDSASAPVDALAHESTLAQLASETRAWPLLAIGAIVFELALAAGYLYAVGQDRRTGRSARLACLALWGVAVMLHVGIMLMPLKIGIFSLYMLLCACVFLLPAEWLGKAAGVVAWPLKGFEPRAVQAGVRGRRALGVIEALVVAAVLAAVGAYIDLPGVWAGSWAAAAILVVSALLARFRGQTVRGQSLAALLFVPLMLGVAYGTDVPYRFHLKLAQSHHFLGDPRDAAAAYEKAISLMSAPHPEPHQHLGDLLREAGRPAEARKHFETALKLAPEDPGIRSQLGDVSMLLQRYDDAIVHYREAVSLSPDDALVRYNLAYALQTRQRIDEAIEHYRLAAKSNPDLVIAHNNLATLLLYKNRRGEAIPHLREVLRLDGKEVGSLNNLAWLLATGHGEGPDGAKEAVELAARAAELTHRRDPVVLGTLAEAHFAAGNRELAVKTAQEALASAREQDLTAPVPQLERRLARYRSVPAE